MELQSDRLLSSSSTSPPRDRHEREEEEGLGQKHLMDSVHQLTSLSTCIDAFKQRMDDLRDHLHSIHEAIDSRTLLLQSPNPVQSEVEQLCHSMCSRGLRRYVVARLSQIDTLRRDVPPALRDLTPDPAKLVLDCVGGFYLQGSKAFSHDSPMIPARQAAILVLEFFLLADDARRHVPEEEESALSVKQEAESAAIAWRKRLIAEGGISKASETDARGLLLFIASFGIPHVFRNGDVAHLLRLSNWKEVAEALRCSSSLVARMPDIVGEMVKIGMSIEAVDVSFSFGLEDKFPPQEILSSFLKETKEMCDNSRRAYGSPMAMKQAKEKQLSALKSAMKCMEDHNLDQEEVIQGWQIKEMMAKLERDVANINRKMKERAASRRTDVEESSRMWKSPGVKRPKFTPESATLLSHPFSGFREHTDNASLHVIPYGSGLTGHANEYPTASLQSHGSGRGSFPETSMMPTVQNASGLPSVGGRISSGISVMSAGTSADFTGDRLSERVAGLRNLDDSSYGHYLVREAAYRDPQEQRNPGVYSNPSLGYSPSLEGFKGLPNYSSSGVVDHGANYDLYGFADTILER